MPRNESPEQSYTTRWSGSRGVVKFFKRSDGSRLRYLTAGTGRQNIRMRLTGLMGYRHPLSAESPARAVVH